MSISDNETQFARILVERKFCTANEVELVRTEQKDLADKGDAKPLSDLLTVDRLSRASADGAAPCVLGNLTSAFRARPPHHALPSFRCPPPWQAPTPQTGT